MTSPAKSAYMRVVELFKGRQASAADLKAAESAFAETAEGASFLSAPGGPLENMSSGSAVAEPSIKEVVMSNPVVVDAAAYAELVRLAGAAPSLVVQARAALAAAPPATVPAPGVMPGQPSEEAWRDFEYSIRIPGRTPPRRPVGEVWTGGTLPPGAEKVTDAALDAFVASLGLEKCGRR